MLFAIGGVVCVALVITLIVVSAVTASRRAKRRRAELGQWAAQNGWTIVGRPRVNWARRMPGPNGRVTLVLSGVLNGRPVSIADYHYTTTNSRHDFSASGYARNQSTTTTHRYQITVVQLRQPGPTMAVARRGPVSRFGRTLFGDKATALGYEPFDRDYRITAKDPALVRSMFGPTLVAEHVAGVLPDWSLVGAELLTYGTGSIGQPAGIPGKFRGVLRVADLLESRA